MSLFKRKPEPPQEIAAEEKLDEVTREVAAEELETEGERERSGWRYLGPLALALDRFPKKAFHQVPGDPVPEPIAPSTAS